MPDRSNRMKIRKKDRMPDQMPDRKPEKCPIKRQNITGMSENMSDKTRWNTEDKAR